MRRSLRWASQKEKGFEMRTYLSALVMSALVVAAPVLFHAQGQSSVPGGQGYHVVKQTQLGGMGNWDYVTVDPDARR